MPEHPLEGQPMLGFAAWVDVNRRILGFTESLPAGRVLRLRAEDVLDGSPDSLRDVASWLGLSTAARGHRRHGPSRGLALRPAGTEGERDHRRL